MAKSNNKLSFFDKLTIWLFAIGFFIIFWGLIFFLIKLVF